MTRTWDSCLAVMAIILLLLVAGSLLWQTEKIPSKVAVPMPKNVLQPYQRYQHLLTDISIDKEKTIAQFLKKHAKSPLAYQLRKRWLTYLTQQQR